MLVLVLLGVVWVAALAPMVVRKLREREAISSVTSFNRHLLRLSGGSASSYGSRAAPEGPIGYSAAARRLSEQRLSVGLGDSGAIALGRRFGPVTPLTASELGPVVSHATTIRRRRIVAVLALGTIVSFALGFGLSAFFYLAVIGILSLVAYLALLAYFHRLAIEQAQKVVALETRRGVAERLDAARHLNAGIPVVPKSRVGGSGWSVPDEELEDADLERGELVTASR